MEGLAFVFIGAALFSHSWHLLGLYPDGRTMGTYVGALGLATLIALPLTPMLLVGGDPDAFPLAEVTVMKMLIILWAGYAVGVGAHYSSIQLDALADAGEGRLHDAETGWSGRR